MNGTPEFLKIKYVTDPEIERSIKIEGDRLIIEIHGAYTMLATEFTKTEANDLASAIRNYLPTEEERTKWEQKLV